jgi:DNA polymerase (family 10)
MEALRELAELTTLAEGSPQAFRVRAYETAMRAVEGLEGDIASMSQAELVKVKGIGKSTAQRIQQYLKDGRIDKLEALRAEFPPAIVALSHIPGLGPKHVARLRSELGVQSLDDLRRALADESIRDLEGFGEKSEQRLRRALERMGVDGERRTPIAKAMPLAERLLAELEQMPEVEAAELCGSLRRMQETIGDLDIVVAAASSAPIFDRLVAMPMVTEVLVRGDTKLSLLTNKAMQIDVRVVAHEQLGAALVYFTGSKAHNIKLRQLAIDRGWLLNEYALKDADGRVIASRSEEEIYRALGLPFIAAPLREDSGEIERALSGELPEAIEERELLGDLHVHTTLSGDGRSALDDVLARAESRGYRYLAITDHAEDLVINGVSREAMVKQRAELMDKQERHPSMRLLHGCELNIGPKGELDYDQDFRMSFDWCVAAVHSHFDLPKADQTKRIVSAMHNPAVNVIGHLSGRMIGSRPGIELDVDEVLAAAADTGTAIELNSALPRLDAALEVLRRARELGVTLVISTDAHHVDELSRMRWGVRWALRAWVDKPQVANLWCAERFLSWASSCRAG